MHEQSVVKALLNEAARARGDAAGEVLEIRVEIGPLSGVEPVLLALAFEQLRGELCGKFAAGASLVIDQAPLTAACRPCELEFEIEDFVFRCPQCGGNVQVLRGDEIQLISLSIRDDQHAEA